MNILLYYQSISLGGQQTQLLHLCREFSAMGHRVYWAYETGNHLLESIGQWATPLQLEVLGSNWKKPRNRVSHLAAFGIKTLSRTTSLKKNIEQRGINLIVSSESYGSFICGWASGRKQRQFRLIGQDIEALEHPWYQYYRILQIDRFVENYFGWPKVYASLAKKGVANHKFANFQINAVDTTQFFPIDQAQRQQIRKSFGIAEDEIVIGWIGRLQERMQVKNTLKLGCLLRQRGFDKFKILVVGGGVITNNDLEDQTYPTKLRGLTVEYDITNQTVFTGWIPHHDINSYINAMDVVPLLDDDPQGGSILRETMACGRVAISVNGPSGTQQVFMTADNSILLPTNDYIDACADAVIKLATDFAQIENMGKSARDYCTNHLTFKGQAESIINYYEKSKKC